MGKVEKLLRMIWTERRFQSLLNQGGWYCGTVISVSLEPMWAEEARSQILSLFSIPSLKHNDNYKHNFKTNTVNAKTQTFQTQMKKDNSHLKKSPKSGHSFCKSDGYDLHITDMDRCSYPMFVSCKFKINVYLCFITKN